MLQVAIIGCGGVAYHVSTLLAAFLAETKPQKVILIDPDQVEEGNLRRQWPNEEGSWKANAMEDMLPHDGDGVVDDEEEEVSTSEIEYVTEYEPYELEHLLAHMVTDDETSETLVFVFADSDPVRKQVWKDLAGLSEKGEIKGFIGYITAGNDRTSCQAFGGIVENGVVTWPLAITKLRGEGKGNEDVEEGCDGQTALANAMGANLSMELLRYMQEWSITEQVVEKYWDGTKKGGSMWTRDVPADELEADMEVIADAVCARNC